MSSFIDIAYDSINKYGEELCGDKVEMIKTKDSIIAVLADGLGSGVKANILATLTSKIAATMLKEGASIYETVDTIVHTLPVCNVRKIAYSTFTIIKAYYDGRVYVVEYDNPPFYFINEDRMCNIEKRETLINGKLIKESNFTVNNSDVLAIVSDGAVHAGVGAVLNLGWQWENVGEYLLKTTRIEKCAKSICKDLLNACSCLYNHKPGDDTTVVVVKVRDREIVNLFAGPPQNPENDDWVVENLMSQDGRKVVCGGTAANITARVLGEEIKVNMDEIDNNVPPTADIKGIDLVTEGVLTLNRTVEIIKKYSQNTLNSDSKYNLQSCDGASKLAKILIEDCTDLNLWVGKAVNPAHQNPSFPVHLSIKLTIIEELISLMNKLGKDVKLTYV